MNEQLLANPVVSQCIGLIVGLFTSFFSWWVLFRWMAPRVILSEFISKTKRVTPIENSEGKSGWSYRIKFENVGRRSIIDMQVRSYIRIKGLYDENPGIWEWVQLPFTSDGEKVYSIPIMKPVRKTKVRFRLKIHLNNAEDVQKPYIPQSLRNKATSRELLLEELLSIGTSSEIVVVVSGYDELTGARKMVEKIYKLANIKVGEFDRKGLAIVENASNVEQREMGDTP